MAEEQIVRSIAVSIVLGVLGLLLGRKLKIPPLLFFLLFGILAGPTFLKLINPIEQSSLFMPVIEVAVAIIIFEAGLALPLSTWKSAPRAIRSILTITLPITGIAAVLLAGFVAKLSWESALLFGALIVVTGPAVIGPLLRSIALNRRVDSVLRWESIWADCIGVILSGLALEWVLATKLVFWLPAMILPAFLIGVLIGALAGIILGRLIIPWTANLGDPTLPGIVVLSGAVGVFFVSNLLIEHSGVVAAAVAGFVLAQHPLRQIEDIKHFKEQISNLVIAFLFVFLSAQLNLRTIEVQWNLLTLTACLITFVVRPLAVMLALWKTSLTMAERFFVGLTGPRGIIAVAVASYYAILLKDQPFGVEQMSLLTFITVLISGGFVSILGKPLARLFGASFSEYKTGIAIVGFGPFSLELAHSLKSYVDVKIIDSNPEKCAMAKQSDVSSVCQNALSDYIYEELLEDGFRRVVVLTPNSALNLLIAAKAKAHMGINRVFLNVKKSSEDEGSLQLIAERMLAFSKDGIDIGDVDQLILDGKAKLVVDAFENISGRKIPLAYEAGGGIRISRADDKPKGKTICLVLNPD